MIGDPVTITSDIEREARDGSALARIPLRPTTIEAVENDDTVAMLAAALAYRVTELAGDHGDSGDALPTLFTVVTDMYRRGNLEQIEVDTSMDEGAVTEVRVSVTP